MHPAIHLAAKGSKEKERVSERERERGRARKRERAITVVNYVSLIIFFFLKYEAAFLLVHIN